MAVDFKVPELGESISEVFIGEWFVREGDYVDLDQNLLSVETDKANVDIPCPVGGIIKKLNKKAGEKAAKGETIAVIEPSERPATLAKAAPKTTAPAGAPKAAGGPKTMPAAAAILAQKGVSAQDVVPSGPGGRILKEDAQRHVSTTRVVTATGAVSAREERRTPMSPIRQTIAKRLLFAQQNAALLTTFNEVDMTNVKRLREQYQEAFQKKYGIKLGFMSFFVKAVIEGLNQFPSVGARIEGTDLVYTSYQDIGVAIGGGKGLVVPVLRNAERMGFAEIEIAIADFGKRANENKLGREELEGGTFTISNGGVYGSLLSTPIVNPPQSGVLGMHGIVDRPIALNGQVVIRPMMYIALTYDHRVVDGREAVSFLRRVKEVIEEPSRMILEV